MNEEPQEPAVEGTAVEEPAQEPLSVTVAAEEQGAGNPEDFTPAPEELVVSEDRDVFEVMDAHDIEQIMHAMQGRLLDVSLYDFQQGGKRIVELSWKGVRETIAEMHATGKCRIGMLPEATQLSSAHEDGEDWYEALVYARDEITGATFSGFAREPKRMRLRGHTEENPKTKFDVFAQTKAINKAERNALRKFIPERLAQTLIAQFTKDEGRVRQLQSGGPMVGSAAQLQAPPVETDEGKALIREVDGLWDQIRAVPGFAAVMTPAHFFAYKQRAVSQNPDDPEDVTQLVQFKDTLEQTLEIVRRKAAE